MRFKCDTQHHGAMLLWLFVVRAKARWDLGVGPITWRVVYGSARLLWEVEGTSRTVFPVAHLLFLIEIECFYLSELILVLLHVWRSLVLRGHLIIVECAHALILFFIKSGMTVIFLVFIDDTHAWIVYSHGQFLLQSLHACSLAQVWGRVTRILPLKGYALFGSDHWSIVCFTQCKAVLLLDIVVGMMWILP